MALSRRPQRPHRYILATSTIWLLTWTLPPPAQSASLAQQHQLPPPTSSFSSSRILNESFIQSKILQRYHPMAQVKPTVVLRLSGESGMLSPLTASTVPPYVIGSGVLPNTTSLKSPEEAEWAFAPAEHSKLQVFTEKLQKSSSNSYKSQPFRSQALFQTPAVASSISGSIESYSYEDLSSQQSQHYQPWTSAPVEPQPYVGYRAQPVVQSASASSSGSSEESGLASLASYEGRRFDYGTTFEPSSPSAPSSSADRRNDDEFIETFNHLTHEDAGADYSLDELENFAIINDDSLSRFFVKTHPKELLAKLPPPTSKAPPTTTPAPAVTTTTTWTPVPEYIDDSLHNNPSWFNLNYTDDEVHDQKPESTFSASLKNKYVSNEILESYKTSTMEPGTTSRAEFEATATTSKPSRGDYSSENLQQSPSFHFSRAQNYLPDDNKYSSYEFQSTSNPLLSSFEVSTTTPTPTSTEGTSIPGIPGIDYPILGEVPYTGFDCQKQRYKGFFADIDTKCQAWHYCDFTDGHSTFLCPNGTLFSQVLLTCDWWFNVDCSQAQQLYVLNERLYRYIKPPKPSFPEDFHGPQVDLWLAQQLQLGNLPKVKKKIKDKIVIHGNN